VAAASGRLLAQILESRRQTVMPSARAAKAKVSASGDELADRAAVTPKVPHPPRAT
jgi:hypothetical protein